MAQDKIAAPSSMTGIMRFYDVATGGPKFEPRAVVVASIAFILLIKLATVIMR